MQILYTNSSNFFDGSDLVNKSTRFDDVSNVCFVDFHDIIVIKSNHHLFMNGKFGKNPPKELKQNLKRKGQGHQLSKTKVRSKTRM